MAETRYLARCAGPRKSHPNRRCKKTELRNTPESAVRRTTKRPRDTGSSRRWSCSASPCHNSLNRMPKDKYRIQSGPFSPDPCCRRSTDPRQSGLLLGNRGTARRPPTSRTAHLRYIISTKQRSNSLDYLRRSLPLVTLVALARLRRCLRTSRLHRQRRQ